MPDPKPKPAITPWATIGESAEYEDCLIGNREGLAQLRDAVTEALSLGTAQLPPGITSMNKIVLLETDSNPETAPKKGGWKDTLALVSCALLIFPIGLLCILGVISLFKK